MPQPMLRFRSTAVLGLAVPEAEGGVILGRNVIMAHCMLARLREGNAIFGVGALHLYGEGGCWRCSKKRSSG